LKISKRTLFSLLAITGGAVYAGSTGYHIIHHYKIGGEGTWDYIKVDESARRVYVAHQNEVDVVDADSGTVVGKIPAQGSHGIAIASSLGRGFITNGGADTVTVFDLKTLKKISDVPTGKKPDAIMYDPATQRVFAMNGDSNSTTAIDAASAKVAGTIDLGGAPEFAVPDGNGRFWVNLEDKNEALLVDSKKLAVLKRFALAPCDEPASMAADLSTHRLFIGCGNKKMAVVDSESGRVITTVPIGPHVDATAFDNATKLIFSSTFDGHVTVVHEDSPDKFTVVDTLKTQQGSKTMDIDPKTHNLFLSGSAFTPALPPAAIRPPKGTKPTPDTFELLVLGK